jgi:hypothetical protein
VGKGGRCVRLTTLPPSCAVVIQSVNLNFLEPSGPLQACNGTALPYYANKYEETVVTIYCFLVLIFSWFAKLRKGTINFVVSVRPR